MLILPSVPGSPGSAPSPSGEASASVRDREPYQALGSGTEFLPIPPFPARGRLPFRRFPRRRGSAGPSAFPSWERVTFIPNPHPNPGLRRFPWPPSRASRGIVLKAGYPRSHNPGTQPRGSQHRGSQCPEIHRKQCPAPFERVAPFQPCSLSGGYSPRTGQGTLLPSLIIQGPEHSPRPMLFHGPCRPHPVIFHGLAEWVPGGDGRHGLRPPGGYVWPRPHPRRRSASGCEPGCWATLLPWWEGALSP